MTKSIWARVGCTVNLPKDVSEYDSAEELENDLEASLKEGNFKVDGDTYVPADECELGELSCDVSREEPSQELVDKVLAEVVKDVQSGDHTAIEELLKHHSAYALRGYLPEEGI